MTSPESASFDHEVFSVEFFQVIRGRADARFAELAAGAPELGETARTQGREIAETICRSFLEVDPATDPAMPTLESAYAKLAFAFTNPADFRDTLSTGKLLEGIEEIAAWSVPEGSEDNNPLPQAFAYYADLVAAHMLLIKVTMQEAGELEGVYTMDDQYDLVRARLETMTQGLETDENGPLA